MTNIVEVEIKCPKCKRDHKAFVDDVPTGIIIPCECGREFRTAINIVDDKGNRTGSLPMGVYRIINRPSNMAVLRGD